jgi:hypothetical protein
MLLRLLPPVALLHTILDGEKAGKRRAAGICCAPRPAIEAPIVVIAVPIRTVSDGLSERGKPRQSGVSVSSCARAAPRLSLSIHRNT